VVSVRAASTLLVLRDGTDGIEVVMGHRPPGGPFGDVWVFPGGAVEESDLGRAGDADEAWVLAGLRETAEEVGILITDPPDVPIVVGPDDDLYLRLDQIGARFDPSRVVYLSNWVTPRFVPKRFDTRFYLVGVSPRVEPAAITDEFVTVAWVGVSDALASYDAGAMPLIFPTLAHLRYIAGFATVAALEEEARSLDVIPQIEPRAFERGDHIELVVSGDPRFDT
jgi:8-oxo-dGTP pyrophosphatase MutT (NUDIX family)